ncbi:5-(carboxyamino)imidazole ribonucleotide synthase [Macrococcus equipercicus]|uniref:N5-carboxyaminoimidazole ribonucleotide synthase n=1 Tax=Macrococcus equipercicus TaxID=69967 RepID=A0A9Q9F1V7_9STAP|nr:5-(carboxyamino)imidazole ribonucleotide synthase [Macrococcus equipercicus]KAA1042639.1 5-(carboxyamino)imidazole ribonucleotide synthase [Macrococcus equipercicus]UTH14503.1 5-(carboxyamino)imidazole ribonucleotide synthase [Macrococcus equipercicus]
MNSTKLTIGSTIGIIGGGQLGKMMAQSAQRMGFKVAVLDPDETCPARFSAHHFIHASYNDLTALTKLGELSDSVTYEFENIDGEALAALTENYNVPQGSAAVITLQNRLSEKDAVAAAGAQVVPYVPVDDAAALETAAEQLGFPFILKTVFGGYDGKGQYVVKAAEQLESAREFISSGLCVAEQMIDLQSEISITATAAADGSVVFFPVQENVHRNQILYRTTVTGTHRHQQNAINEVKKIMADIKLIGTFTVEFFIDQEDKLYVNEIAPRPHNSGHYSIEACDYSQFDTHILAVAGWGLPEQITLHQPAVMYNLLGQDLDVMAHVFSEHPEWHVHVYGKEVRKHDRKMGHVTILTTANDYETIYEEQMK